MATFSADLWGIYLTLTESETKEIETAADVGSAISAIVAGAASGIPGGVAASAISAVLAGYLQLEKAVVGAVDQGAGVTLNLPWIAIYAEQFWVIYPTPVSPTLQNAWWWCSRCDGLFWSGTAGKVGGVCPTGGQHGPNTSSNYKLAVGIPTSPGQHDWRWCTKCSGLFWSGGAENTGVCPAGGAHGPRSGSGDYGIDMNDPNFAGQHNWRFCGKCNGLFWDSASPTGGVCPAKGTHQQAGSADYALMN
jgi:hypothetical protein